MTRTAPGGWVAALLTVAVVGAIAYGVNATASAPAAPAARGVLARCVHTRFGPALAPLDAPAAVHRYRRAPAFTINVHRLYLATVSGPAGQFTVCLVPSWAPHTVNNFVMLARNHFFDGLRWVRDPSTAPGGPVIQGGSPLNTMAGGPGYTFGDEPVRGPLYRGGAYLPGAVAMANSGPNTNGSQFFVTLSRFSLPAHYNLFGAVIRGLTVARHVRKGQPMTVTVRAALP